MEIIHSKVMACFDNKEFVSNWERLRKKKCRGKKNMELFIEDIKNTVWDRIPKSMNHTATHMIVADLGKENN